MVHHIVHSVCQKRKTLHSDQAERVAILFVRHASKSGLCFESLGEFVKLVIGEAQSAGSL